MKSKAKQKLLSCYTILFFVECFDFIAKRDAQLSRFILIAEVVVRIQVL